jgi:RNA polymerase sigma-70 factor (ECF subfamily)
MGQLDIDPQLERELALRLKKKDHEAFKTMMARYSVSLYNLALRYLGHHEDAVDVTQETFVRFYETLDRWDPARSLQNWLLTIGRNLCIDYLRRRGREKRIQLERPYSPDPAQRETAKYPDHSLPA